jgi:hypothetical protein
MVMAYRQERHRQENDLHAQSIGYATEAAEITAAHPLVTFKTWLTGRRTP